jgi:general secretion pathway protein E
MKLNDLSTNVAMQTLFAQLDRLLQQRLDKGERIDESLLQGLPSHDEQATANAVQMDATVLDQTNLAQAVETPASGVQDYSTWLELRSGLPVRHLADWLPLTRDPTTIPFAEGVKRLCIAMRDADQRLHIVLADPFSASTRLWLQQRLRQAGQTDAIWCASTAADIQAHYVRMEREVKALDAAGNDGNQGTANQDLEIGNLSLSLASISEDESPIVRFVNSTLYDALRAQASDIHLETVPSGLTVKYRLDGVLNTITHQSSLEAANRVISRVKVLADLDISEHRVPQDGRIKIRVADRSVDLRVSIMPSLHGEDAVLRILDRYQLAESGSLSVSHLGFDDKAKAFCRDMALMPHGLFLVTGPTGSGKTTTLYGLISEVATGMDKIVTIEDPVEYQLNGVLQIPVNEAKGLTFAKGLRSILRHDPDRIMVGEIRDAETAQIAIQAALTGHQVYATVHANNVFDAVGRMTSMQADLYNLVAALNGILAQRLLRINCLQCLEPVAPTSEQIQRFGLHDRPLNLARSIGCSHCRGTGFKGRRAIAQTMRLDPALRTQIASRASFETLHASAQERGLNTLREAAIDLAVQGLTTLEEAARVTVAEA